MGGIRISYTNESYAAMLLTLALSPNKEEYARPYSTQEFYALSRVTADSPIKSVGNLIGTDISRDGAEKGTNHDVAPRLHLSVALNLHATT